MKTKFQWRLTPDPSALSAAAVTKTLLKAFFRYLAEVAASEAGELLSVRRKSHLLHAQMYARLDTQAAPQRTAPTTTEFSRCRGATQNVAGAQPRKRLALRP